MAGFHHHFIIHTEGFFIQYGFKPVAIGAIALVF